MRHAFTEDLKVGASPALLERGCVQVIGLEGIKAEIGDRWEKLKESIWAHLETLLRQKLGATDFYVQLNETAFLVTMPSASTDEAQIFCLRVAHELHNSLLGCCDTARLEIARATHTADNQLHTVPVFGDQLRLLAIQANLIIPKGDEIFALTGLHGTGTLPPQPKYSHKYVPLWDVQKEAVTTYRCISPVDMALADNVGVSAQARMQTALTLSRIRHATGMTAVHLAGGDRFMMTIPIPYDTLCSPAARMEITAACRSLSSHLRPYLFFEISELPYGVPQSRLSELVGALRPFCRGVTTQLPARIANYGAYLGVGLHSIGLSLSVIGSNGGEMASELFKLTVSAKRQRIRCFALDVPNEELLRQACAQGVNVLSGPLIGPARDEPAPIRRLSLDEIGKSAMIAA